jgi:hypothetical protein
VSTLVAFRELGSMRRLFWAATAAGTTALGLKLAGALDCAGKLVEERVGY